MKVQELLDKLQGVDGDIDVCVYCDDCSAIYPLESLEINYVDRMVILNT
jgi:hypothetical protein